MRSAYNIELSTRIEVEMTDFRGVQCIYSIYGKTAVGNKQLGLRSTYIARYWHKLPPMRGGDRAIRSAYNIELSARNRPATDSFPWLILQIQLYIVTRIASIARYWHKLPPMRGGGQAMRSAYNIELSTRIEVEMTDFRGVQCIYSIYMERQRWGTNNQA